MTTLLYLIPTKYLGLGHTNTHWVRVMIVESTRNRCIQGQRCLQTSLADNCVQADLLICRSNFQADNICCNWSPLKYKLNNCNLYQ